ADGLAMSSRNAYLKPDERAVAGRMNVVLNDAVARLKHGDAVDQVEAFGKSDLLEAGFNSVDYVAVRDAATLERIARLDRPARILAAAKIGGTRLIDNMAA
ncbi:MAG: pantoate--beta-alanine ligase, partial [Alphaproteobacteria bacterium]|nr:pantoate--beta-alanine ligase [Alphaproteobacteria bacterium]